MKNYFSTKGPPTEGVWEPLQQVFLSLCIKEPRRSSGRTQPAPAGRGQLALRPVDGTLRLPPQLTEQLPLCLERWGCAPAPSQLPTSASALPQAPGLPSELPPWKVILSRNLMNKTPSQPRSQQASRGLPHTLRLEQCPQTKPLIHRGREWWESGRGIPRAAQPLKGQLGFWVKIYMKIMPLCPASLPQPHHRPGGLWSDTFPPSILPWSHNPPLVTSQLLIQ